MAARQGVLRRLEQTCKAYCVTDESLRVSSGRMFNEVWENPIFMYLCCCLFFRYALSCSGTHTFAEFEKDPVDLDLELLSIAVEGKR